jgi:hypothetical protein
VGLGALTLARHPALSSVGTTVMLGLCGVIPSALFVIPALYGRVKIMTNDQIPIDQSRNNNVGRSTLQEP